MPDNWGSNSLDHWLTRAFAREMESAWAAASTPPAFRPVAAEPALWSEWSNPTWVRVTLDGIGGGEVRVGCVGETVNAIVASLGRDDDGVASVFNDVVNQVLASSLAAAPTKLDRVIAVGTGEPSSAPTDALGAVEFRFEIDGVPHTIALAPDSAMAKVLSASPETSATSSPKVKATSATKSRRMPENLAVLMDVELDLAVSFGTTVMPLEEVARLGSGAIVELNRGASDPVDLLINDSVIARGDVVVVDGNYGVRVTHIVSPSERIATVL